MFYERWIRLVDEAAKKATDENFGKILVKAVTEELSYEKVAANRYTNCGKEVWYAAYRRFFWILDKMRN